MVHVRSSATRGSEVLGRLRTTVLAALLVTACSVAGGTEPRDIATVGFLRAVATSTTGQSAMEEELRRAGFVPGRDVEFLGTDPMEAHPDPEDAADVVRTWADEGLDVLIALSTTGARAASEALPGVPVVFISNDPVAVGLVQDEQAPEGQLTGVTYRVPADRTLDVARRAIPDLEHVGFLFPDTDPAARPHRDAVASAADALDLRLTAEGFVSSDGIAQAVGTLADAGVQAIVVANAPTAVAVFARIKEAADRHGLPTIANTDVAEGALVMLAPDPEELFRQVGRQAVRLLRGAQPSEVPVEDPRHFDVILDADVADALGIVFPADLVREANLVRGGAG